MLLNILSVKDSPSKQVWGLGGVQCWGWETLVQSHIHTCIIRAIEYVRLLAREETLEPDYKGFIKVRFFLLFFEFFSFFWFGFYHLCSFAFNFLCQILLYQVEVVSTWSFNYTIKYSLLTIILFTYFYFSTF